MSQVLLIETPTGTARATLLAPAGAAAGLLVLGHGAGGGIGAADLVAVAGAAVLAGWRVALVEQPWRVAGRRVAPAPARLDAGWLPVLAELAGTVPGPVPGPAGTVPGPLVVGGRSAGARVACRTALDAGAAAVLCLAFPLHPPGRPERSRLAELAGAGVPVLAVQGRRDPFGTARELRGVAPDGVRVVEVDGDHGMAAGAQAAAAAVAGWLPGVGR